MNKKLIAVALAAATAAPAAFAETTLYGRAHADIRNTDTGAADMWSVNSNASRLGVTGSEDLGNGLKAVFRMEMQYNLTDGRVAGTPIQGARNAFVGVAGDFGTVLVGTHDTPAKVAFYAAGNEHLGDSIIDINRIGFTEFRVDNAIAYISPSMSGFTVAAALVPGETAANNGLTDAVSLGAMYSGMGLRASLGYTVADSGMTLPNTTGGTVLGAAGDHEMIQAGASYTFGNFTVGGNYEESDNFAGGAADKEVWGLMGRATFGNNFVVVNGGNMEMGAADTDSFGIGFGHNFSSRTQVYVAYRNADTGAADTDEMALGLVHSF